MALVRCDKKHSPPKRKKKHRYVQAVQPIGYPNTAAICGREGCREPGLVWLNVQESEEYQRGERIFDFQHAGAKIRVQ